MLGESVLEHLEIPWNWESLLINPNLVNLTLLLKFYEKKIPDWIMNYISENPNIKLKDILNHPQLNWKWDFISSNSSITESDILAHPELPWNWCGVSMNRNITLKIVLSYPEKKWDWNHISSNPNITLTDILSHPELPWEWGYVSMNPSITLKEILKQNLEKKYSVRFGVFSNEFLWNDIVYKKNLKNDVQNRREKVKSLAVFGSLETLVNKYVGYV